MTELNTEDRHVISVVVDNEFGALARVVSLFSARGYNIETLSVAVIDSQDNLSRMTITTYGSQEVIDLIIKLLHRLVAVHDVTDLTNSGPFLEKECALIKVSINEKNKDEVLRVAHTQKAKLLNHTNDYMIFELTDGFSRIRAFISLLEPYGILETSRTGYAALPL